MHQKKSSGFLRLKVDTWGIVTAAGIIGCAVTVFGFLGKFSWFLDLFAHFRVQYVFGLMILAVALLWTRRYKTASVFAVFVCVNIATVTPLYFGGQSTDSVPSHTLRVMLVNVNTDADNAKQVTQAIQKAEPDILLLEEVNASFLKHLQWTRDTYEHSCLQPRPDNFGIGLFSKLPLEETEVVRIGEAGVPSVLAVVEAPSGRFRFIGTHTLPPAGQEYSRLRNEQLQKLPQYVSSSLPTLLLGDLNVTPWSYHFQRLRSNSRLHNSMNGRGVQPTWPAPIPFLGIPIDHCLHSSDITIVGRKTGHNVGSDHYPVIVDFAVNVQSN